MVTVEGGGVVVVVVQSREDVGVLGKVAKPDGAELGGDEVDVEADVSEGAAAETEAVFPSVSPAAVALAADSCATGLDSAIRAVVVETDVLALAVASGDWTTVTDTDTVVASAGAVACDSKGAVTV